MMNSNDVHVLKNYRIMKGKNLAEFPKVEVRFNDNSVFTNLPICQVPYHEEVTQGYLLNVDPHTKIALVVTEEVIQSVLNTTKIFHLSDKSEGEVSTVKEVPQTEAVISVRLPIDTNVSELIIQGGQVYKLGAVEEINDETENITHEE